MNRLKKSIITGAPLRWASLILGVTATPAQHTGEEEPAPRRGTAGGAHRDDDAGDDPARSRQTRTR